MADDRAYRVLIQYIPEDGSFVAQSPELDLKAVATTRAEAIESLEREIDEAIQKAANEGEKLRRPIDVATESGEVTLKLASPIWKDLLFHAESQKLEPAELAAQILGRGLSHLDGRRRKYRSNDNTSAPAPESSENKEAEASSEAPQRSERKEGGPRHNNRSRGRGRGRREGYRPDMDDQANFLAYVRDQERGGRGRR